MLPDLSLPHILIVIVVALIVVGPKDLPQMLRRIGKFVGKMRGMAHEFRSSFDEMARQSELDELRKEVEAMRKASQQSLPDLGIEAAMQSDAEAAYLANWEASHAAPTDSGAPEPSILPPAAETPAPKAAKPKVSKAPASKATAPKTASPKTGSQKPAKTEVVAEAAPKPRARKTAAKKAESGTDA